MHAADKRLQIINSMLQASPDATPENTGQSEPFNEQATGRESQAPEPIAIIGLSGYLPQSNNVQEFWDALDKDRSLIEEIPESRINWKNIYDPGRRDFDKSHTKWGGIMPGIRNFDAHFFGILPDEADLMDPRKRLLLMSVYHALEDAGYAPRSLGKETVGVFVAVEEDEYRQCLVEKGIDIKTGSGNSSSLIANQISYFFDFRGPSEVINTMCSGSAVAIHRAVRALRSGEISYAVVGGANILLHPDPFVFLSRTGQMSPVNTVHSFGKEANGFLRAEGVASIILKPLSKAVEDKDAIYAVIKNTAVNYNGKGGLSMASPNVAAHTELIRTCYEEANIDPRQVQYMEAQGMGNPVADIAEWEAFNKALKAIALKKGTTLEEGACRVSTLKPMIGHMHASSALGALFKIIRSFQTNTIHKIPGLKEINPDLDMAHQPCRLVTATEHWPEETFARLAGLHSYGSGGNNAHILIEEYKGSHTAASSISAPGKVIIPCSAVTKEQCIVLAGNLADAVEQNPAYSLPAIAHTLQTGRDAMKYRVAFIVDSCQELIEQARAYARGNAVEGVLEGEVVAKVAAHGLDFNDPASIAKAWIKGVEIPWDKMPFKELPQRLHLPVFPFNCHEYWMDSKQITTNNHQNDILLPAAEQMIRNTLGFFLRIAPEAIDLQEEFSALGFDSLLVTNLTRKLEQQYAVKLEPAIFFEHTTPARLIAFISGQFHDQLTGNNEVHARQTGTVDKAPLVAGNIPGEKEPIAIIGLAGSFPQSPGIELFWKNIIAGVYCVEEIPEERWPVNEHFHPDKDIANKTGKSYGKWGGFMKDLYYFDPLFFNISPSEAATMNPKERLFLQCTWHALEDAGYTPRSLAHEEVGVFVGVTRSGLDPYKVSMFPIANRVSYVFNFRGPSMPVDTACSSSLVAIHEACQHIHAGECTVAIAGGVHAFLDPSHFAALSELQMLSPEGLSKSFGEDANGMVPGEGVGAVLLKPLKKAIADKDHIYGIIRGSSTNHGGKANGFTVPNPRAHTELIQNALKKAAVKARQVNYVEAHGTGTSLGDPIEIRGLAEAFKNDTADIQYCPIGSIKSNIGHLEAAAGISGLTKVLLQMKYGKLAPSLHSKRTNPQIDFSKTPFYVQQEVTDWKPVDGKGNEVPRMACISSFGAGGANAHVIIEEYPQKQLERLPEGPAIILLSARSGEQLKEKARQLLSFLDDVENDNDLLHSIAYTLQVGREAMEERMAVIVTSLEELKHKLNLFIAGAGSIEQLYAGNAKKYKEAAGSVEGEEVAHDYDKLLSAWVKGSYFDWNILYQQHVAGLLPYRVSLPVYPFLKEYFGLPDAGKRSQPSGLPESTAIHPLVHRNVSTFSEQKFSSTFTGREFFLQDHIVNGQRVLPGVAYLEMAYTALGLAAGDVPAGESGQGICLKNVVWAQPVVVADQPAELNISLLPDESGAVNFEIYSEPAGKEQEDSIIHSQGSIGVIEKEKAPSMDLHALKIATGNTYFSADQCYSLFDKIGIAYGPSHRAIEYLSVGNEQVLAKLSIPAGIAGTLDKFYLHPALMDAAFQAIMGFMAAVRKEGEEALPLAVPFALEELKVFDKCTASMWAHIRYNERNEQKNGPDDINNLVFDIELCNEAGYVCVEAKGFTSRVLQKRTGNPLHNDLLFLQPSWETWPVTVTGDKVRYEEHIVLYAHGLIEEQVTLDGIRLIALPANEVNHEDTITHYTLQVFTEVKRLLQSKPKEKILIQVLITADSGHEMLCAVGGLLKTAGMENPQLKGQVIVLEKGERIEEIAVKIEQNSRQYEAQQIRYVNGQRRVCRLRQHMPGKEAHHPWKDGGVYLVTGGAGGLGLIFARDIALQAKDAVLILTGRAALTEEKQKQLENIRSNGARIEYRQVDIAHAGDTLNLVQQVVQDYGKLHMVIHAAGVLRDNYILKKTADEVREVLAPKVQGLINLDQATKDLPLEHFVVFSSVAGVMGNTGQADYAVANAFMDGYTRYRNALVAAGERKGFTTAVNWPLWKEGGMQVSEAIKEEMMRTIGMHPLETAIGLKAFYEIMAAGREQMMVVAGNLQLLKNTFLDQPAAEKSVQPEKSATTAAPAGEIKEKAVFYFKKLLSGVIKLSADRIDADTPMEEYGIDSIMVMKLTSELEKVFGSLPKTLFFEYQNISELTNYFLGSYAAKLNVLLGTGNKVGTEKRQKQDDSTGLTYPDKAPVATSNRQRNRFAFNTTRSKEKEHNGLDIAIVGVAGRYPQARDLQEFWNNLYHGKNCVTEVPKDRWDHNLYFDTDKSKPGKTYTKWGGFLDGVDEFDPLFFNISPKEATTLDPQERLFLQCAYEALEDAGYTRDTLVGRNKPGSGNNIGVYVGVMWEEYHLYAAQETILGRPMVLSSSPSSIANRVSYFFNFNGPSMAVDTMCSSSLTSIHLACQSLQQGECEAAIAGGVNVSIHPNKYLVLGYGRYASSKGLCESFGAGGDGYVAGEGVGAVLLKPLSKAIADNDHIYGVIKGTAVNHGGKVNGFTVPNPKAQSSVIDRALKISGFAPRTISYLEAHGTGTSLGDPIEMAALSKAFDTEEKKFCAIGSAKSNIGHCESAAGIAGITKVLLQMKHRQLVPSLHSKVQNPNIDFENTPFIVQQELAEWRRPVIDLDGKVREYPRRAGVSSFGAGGSNAHIVLEEYIPEEWNNSNQPLPATSRNPAAIVLSAKNEERLLESAKRLLAAIQNKVYEDKDLLNIAYTLQVGREGMEDRLAIEATSMKELEDKLECFIRGEKDIENLYVGKVKLHKEILSFFTSDEDMDHTVDSWVKKKKYSKLLGLWVNGFDFNWEQLYSNPDPAYSPPQRISLPAYPFMRNRYWPAIGDNKGSSGVIHPLLHQNTSTFAEQKFSSIFTGEEFFLKDHLVDGEKLLPGVAYLEMINEAMVIAGGQKSPGIQVENMVWAQPLMVNGHPEKVDIGLLPHANGEVSFEIYSTYDTDEKKPVTYSRGVARYVQRAASPVVDLKMLKDQAGQNILDANACYTLFLRMGIAYGPAQRGIESLYIGEGQILARLKLPDVVANTFDQYCLHPSLMDASLQAVIGFWANQYTATEDIPLAIPFAIKSVAVYSRCTPHMWACVRYSGGQAAAGKGFTAGQLSFDIDVCDELGNVCVQIQEFTSRVVRKDEKALKRYGVLMMEPYWKQQEADFSQQAIHYARHLVVVIENDELARALSVQLTGVKVVPLNLPYPAIATGFENYALPVFREIKQLLGAKIKNRILMQVIMPSQGEKHVFSAIAGLLKTAQLENPLFAGQVIGITPEDTTAAILDRVKENCYCPSDTLIRYRENKREVAALREYVRDKEQAAPVWKDGGVYLITGGAGGLGLIFVKEIARQAKGATVILTGRSLLNEQREQQVNEIRSMGVRVEYRQVDVADGSAVDLLVENIIQEFGRLHGIIHAAGILRDNFILKKPEEEILEVLAPKIKGLVHVDIATREIDLDFFIICSSTAGITGNIGQADYAMANACMDRYASHRAALVLAGQRSGKTLSVNWPLWKEGGMHVTEENEKYFLENIGMVPLDTAPGLNALYEAMTAGVEQIMIMQGEVEKLRATFLQETGKGKAADNRIQAQDVHSNVVHGAETNKETYGKTAASAYLKQILSAVINLPADQINAEKPMEEYGIDSVMVMQMTSKLEKVFGSLSKTLFFEYQSIDELADYFLDAFPEKFKPLPVAENIVPVIIPESTGRQSAWENRFVNISGNIPAKKTITDSLDIAIVGIAGRYPNARDLQAFWQVLKNGTNCITEIPGNRWRHDSSKSYSKWGGFIDGVDEFDPLFFGISAGEAEVLDPQERLFLQCAYEALEDAGYARGTLGNNKELGITGNVGVYVGVMWDEYQLYGAQETALGKPLALSGVAGSIANRVSYFCNLNGPSIVLNTMCSSSLTAIHLACQSIQQGECEAAIAGGVNVTLHPNKYMVLEYGSFLSSKGLCESFGAGGDGYVPGEGVGAIILKPLSRAIADNDHIYGVIKGSAVNHGGKTNGYTVPNPKAQANVIGRAMTMAGFDPGTISYLEAHGTGTSLGDPIEITGLSRAFGTKEAGFCAIGSVKSNIGHCESASGIAGLTKVLLQMKHRQLVPSLHSTVLNPNIDFENSPFIVQQELADWKRPVLTLNGKTREYPRRAGISSFGAGGSNAHLLLEEYIPENARLANQETLDDNLLVQKALIVLSARNEARLKQQAERLLTWIKTLDHTSTTLLMDMAYTLQVGRDAMKERWAVAVSSFGELDQYLEKYTAGEKIANAYAGRVYDTNEELNGMGTKEEMGRRIDSWISRAEYGNLLDAWVKGIPFNWHQLYAKDNGNTYHPQRISLPTYPFAPERYWIPQPAGIKAAMESVREATVTVAAAILPASAPETGYSDKELLLEKIGYKLKVLLAGIVKYNVDHIDQKDPLENYGIDSVMIVKLNKQLAEVYGELPATLFYEYQTLDALAGYLTKDHYQKSVEWTGMDIMAADSMPQAKNNTAPATNASMVPSGNGQYILERTDRVPGFDGQNRESIAIIGMSGRYPGAKDLHEYWENLKAGKDCITEIPGDRWDMDDFFHADTTQAASLGKSYGKWGGFIDGFADFDPRFFNISPKEAIGTDPQIRLFIESCWQVLEDAGYTKQQLAELYKGNVGVFAGVTRAGFTFYAPELLKMGQYSLNTMSAVANRVSYILNLKGPSVPVDTMCSSSLTAIHEACESLLRGRCEMAIAGGVNLLLHPSEYVILSANNFLATDGRCRSFGAGGSGYVPGEGVGTVLLKPLSKAIADNDHIYAIIKGTSINHGGKTNGYTVPNPVAHGELIRNALDTAGINAREVSYIEAHGTGTSLGDPIEITGLTQAFRTDTADRQYCSIGSAKSNIGHLEAAAGIAGLAKIVLQMKHRVLVPSLHAKELNPNINFEQTPFFVQQTLSEWKRPVREINGAIKELPRIAGISSFGAGGSNAHVILEEYVPDAAVNKKSKPPVTITAQHPAIVLLSARTDDRLKARAKQLLTVLQQGQYQDAQLPNIAYTLQVGREAMDERLALEARSVPELIDKLEAYISGQQMQEGVFEGKVKDHKETISLLTADKDMAIAINAWIAGRKYSKLLGLWVKGLEVDWNKLYVNDHAQFEFPKRIPLPGYPFEKKRYWVIEADAGKIIKTPVAPAPADQMNGQVAGAGVKRISAAKEEEPFKLMTFEEVWQAKTIEVSQPGNMLPSIKTLVCFSSHTSHQQAITAAIAAWSRETEVIFISHTRDNIDNGVNQYAVDKKDDPASYLPVFNAIIATHGEIHAMVYCWPLEDASLTLDYSILVAILQSIGNGKIKTKHFVLAGQWQQQPGQPDLVRCYLESWIGFERSMRLILPGVQVKAVYQEARGTTIAINDWMHKIWVELNGPETRSALYKEGERYVYQIRPSTLNAGTSQLKKGGTYLITGGLGSLGLLFARHLAEHYSANLILTGRSLIDLEKQEEIRKLEYWGGQVFYLQADVCDREAMQQGLDQAKERLGDIHGIIHTAGVIGAQLFLDKTIQGFQKVLAPKIDGTVLLDDLLRNEPLDFVCYFTSSSAILGDFGACDYSIANRFQMAFAQYRSQLEKQGTRKGKTIAINWPLWKDGGMDLNEEESTKMYLKSSGQRYLLTDEGIAIFEQLIAQEAVQQLVLVGQESRINRFLGLQPAKQEKPVDTVTAIAATATRPVMKELNVAQSLEWDLVDLVSKAQQIPKDELDVQENLADLGFDSISLTTLALALSHHYGIEMAPAIFFGYSSIEKLKEYFMKEHHEVVEALYRKPPVKNIPQTA